MKAPSLFHGQVIYEIKEIEKSSSPAPLDQFQPNLAKSILFLWKRILVRLNGKAKLFLHREIITKLQEYIHEIKKSPPVELLGLFYNIYTINHTQMYIF